MQEVPLLIYGCGGHARSLADVALANKHTQLIFVDEKARPNEQLFGFDVVNTFQTDLKVNRILALGDNYKRAQLFEQFLQDEAMRDSLVSLVAEDAHIGKNALLEAGVFVGRGAHVGPNAMIGANTILNTHCVVEHDCRIGQHCHISVNATIAGTCRIGDLVMVGAGATVIDGTTICSNVMIGAGAVVIHSITEPGTYVGVPAIKKR